MKTYEQTYNQFLKILGNPPEARVSISETEEDRKASKVLKRVVREMQEQFDKHHFKICNSCKREYKSFKWLDRHQKKTGHSFVLFRTR